MKDSPRLVPGADRETDSATIPGRFRIRPTPGVISVPGFVSGVDPGTWYGKAGFSLLIDGLHRANFHAAAADFAKLGHPEIVSLIQLQGEIGYDLAYPDHGAEIRIKYLVHTALFTQTRLDRQRAVTGDIVGGRDGGIAQAADELCHGPGKVIDPVVGQGGHDRSNRERSAGESLSGHLHQHHHHVLAFFWDHPLLRGLIGLIHRFKDNFLAIAFVAVDMSSVQSGNSRSAGAKYFCRLLYNPGSFFGITVIGRNSQSLGSG